MIKVGLTGGIGSGKTTVAEVFRELGIRVYHADDEAKKFLLHAEVQAKLILLFGNSVVRENEVDKAALASIVFKDASALKKLNKLIHPLLRQDYLQWCEKHGDESYTIIEAAILFENAFNSLVDKTIVVCADKEERIKRSMYRDGSSRDQVVSRINNQWPQEKIVDLSDFVLYNNDKDLVVPQIIKLHQNLLELCNTKKR